TSPLKNDYLRALADADGVMAQSPYQQQRLRTELSVESMVVPNLVELPAKASDSEGTYVLWVGRAAPVKRPWVFIETARTLPDINFVMVMPREDHLFWLSVTPETETLPNLQLIPGAPYFEMDQHYRGAAMLAGTSAFEGFPNVFLQAAAHGKPVVSLDGDPGGMLKQHNAGYDAEGDIESFRARIVQWMADASERRRVGSSAREYVTSVHSPASVTPALVEFFSQVLGT
ncbi:MAG: glycosyltransferase, partial [Actinomycetota bacterium]|nr:glycosyltransferase [Actinomycetota bacterium]